MKNLIYISAFLLVLSCSRVTTQPDTQAATSGTMGSVRATNTPPAMADTTRVIDSTQLRSDSGQRQ